MYFIDKDFKEIRTVFGTPEIAEKKIKWSVESGVIGFDFPDKKYISNITLRLSLELGAKVFISIMYDSLGSWEVIGTVKGNTLKSMNIPIKPRRCDHFRLKFEGEGNAKIYSLCKTLVQGGEY
jgi:hypothetical protein